MNAPLRVSPLAAALTGCAPQWALYNDMAVARSIGSAEQERARLNRVGLADLSCLRRFGLKGPAAEGWLQASGCAVVPGVNQWQPNGACGLVARLAASEFFVEDGSSDEHYADAIRSKLGRGAPGVTPVERQDAEIALSGPAANELLLQTCSFDFQSLRLSERPLVMTSMIGVSVLVIASSCRDRPLLRLWCDPTFAPYLWHHLAQIAEQLDGGPIGLGSLFPNLDLGVATSFGENNQ